MIIGYMTNLKKKYLFSTDSLKLKYTNDINMDEKLYMTKYMC